MGKVHVGEKQHDTEVLAKADEEIVLSRLFCNSDAFSQGTSIQMKRYLDRCFKCNETQTSTLSFDGWSDDPVLFKGEVYGPPDDVVQIKCSAVVNIAAVKKSQAGRVASFQKLANPKKWFARTAPQEVAVKDRFVEKDLKLCKVPAVIST